MWLVTLYPHPHLQGLEADLVACDLVQHDAKLHILVGHGHMLNVAHVPAGSSGRHRHMQAVAEAGRQ